MKKPLLLLIPALFLIASCGEAPKPNPEHQHQFSSEWSKNSAQHWHAATCEHTDLKSDIGAHVDNDSNYICDICGYGLPVPPPIEHTHTFATEWTTSSTEHWHVATCGHDVVDGKGKHIDDDGDNICDVCLKDLTNPEPKKPCPEGQCVDANEDGFCDVCGFPYEYKHAKTVKGDPNAPFFLKVGEEKLIKAVLDPVPERDLEKTFKWKTSNSSIATITPDTVDTRNATVKALKSGEVIITATNDYSPSLKYEFHINCIDFSSGNMSLWEYSNNDKNQFGYTSDNKAGIQSGTANLGGLEWDFTRSEVVSLNTSKTGMIGFGKGKAPETRVELVNKNKRKVERIEIQTVSAYALTNITIKVGDTEVINCKTPSSTEDVPPAINSGTLEDLTGDISILFETPEYDAKEEAEHPDTYKAPGAFYIKYIWITYEPEIIEYVTEKTYDFASMYADTESEFYKLVPSSAAAKVYEDDDFVISFAKIAKPADSDKNPNCAKTNADIEIFPKNNKEVIKTINFEYAAQTNNNNRFDVYTSVLGGAPYTTKIASGDNSSVSAVIYDANINAVKLAANTNYNVALKTLTIKTVAGEHAVMDSVAFTEGAAPTKLEYNDGDLFDPTGLGEATVKFTNTEIPDVKISTDSFTYYDGPSYDKPEDHSGKKTTLSVGTTYIYAVYKNFEIKIEGLTVELVLSTFSKVKSVSELSDGTYLITCPSKKAILKGSADTSSTFGASKYIDYVDSCEFGDEISLNQLYENEVVTFTLSNNVYHLSTLSGKNIGMTGSNGTSVAKSPEFIDWNISIDESGYATMSIIDTAKENAPYYYGYGSTTFKFTATSCSNVVLYKLAN